MSTVVCHMEKYNKMSVGGIQHEDWYRDKNNPNLDLDKTKDNYVLTYHIDNKTNLKQLRYHRFGKRLHLSKMINKRLAKFETQKTIRKDAVVCASFIIGSDKEFFDKLTEKQTEKYFGDCFKFFVDRYGDRVMGASVHMDEATPHMHLRIFPEKNGRLCCKELFNRTELQNLQKELPKYLRERGYALEEPVHGSKRKHRDEVEQRLYASEKTLERANTTLEQVEQIRDKVDVLLQATEQYHEQIQNVLEHTGIGRNETLDHNRSAIEQGKKDIDTLIANAKSEVAKQAARPRLPKQAKRDEWSR